MGSMLDALLQALGLSLTSATVILVAVIALVAVLVTTFGDWLLELDAGCREATGKSMLLHFAKSEEGKGAGHRAVDYLEDPSTPKKIPLPSVFSAHEKALSIVFPAFNEESRLSATLDDTLRYLENRAKVEESFTYEIVVVDDGSSDRTASVGYACSSKKGVDVVRVIRLPRNQGKGAAVRKGVLCSRGALILFADADAATRISDLEKLEEELWKEVLKSKPLGSVGATINPVPLKLTSKEVLQHLRASAEEVPAAAFGSRAHLEKQALATRRWYRNILMHGFHLAVVLVAGTGLRDTQCGFKLFSRAAAREVFSNLRLKRWCFDVEIFWLCKRLRIPFTEVAVTWTEVPGSKLRPTSAFHMLLELALIGVGYDLGFWPVRRSFQG